MEWSSAYLQLYREQAIWNERTSQWIERVGLDFVKEALANKEDRLALVARIENTLSLTTDPWKEIIHNKELRKNYEQLADISSAAR